MLSFSSWLSHDIYQCLLIQISLAILGSQPLGPVIGFIRWAMYLPSCSHPSLAGRESFQWDNPSSSSLVWWVCNQPSHEQLVSASCLLCLSFHAFTCWHRSTMEFCMLMQISSALLITSAIASSKFSTISSILDSIPSRISSLSDLVVRQQCIECDHKWSSLSFHLERQDVLSWSPGRSWPNPPWVVLSGTAFPLPLSGGMMLYSHSISLVLGDSCAPASDPPPVGGGFVMASQLAMPLVSSSWTCELTVTLVRFAPDCASMLLCDGLGHATFHFAIMILSLCSAIDCLLCDELWVARCSNKIIHIVNNLERNFKKV